MSATHKLSTTVSSKGQVVLPQAIRRRKNWGEGTRLEIEETPEGIVLRPARVFPPTRIEDVFGCAAYDGPVISLEDMEQAIEAEVEARRARDRY